MTGLALIAIIIGALLVWAGLTNKNLLTEIRSVIGKG